MKKLNSIKYSGIIIGFFFLMNIISIAAHAQNLTEQEVLKAGEYFDEGRYDKVIDLIDLKKAKKISPSLHESAQKLLSASFYEIDEIEKGDSTMYRYLKKFPLYQPDVTTDPEAFINGMRRFSVKPKLNFGVKLGTSFLSPLITQKFKMSDAVDYDGAYQSNLGFQAEVYLERILFGGLAASIGMGVRNISYNRTIYYKNRAGDDFVLQDKILRFETPIMLSYRFLISKYSIVPYAGFASAINRSDLSVTYLGEAIPLTTNNRIGINIENLYGVRLGIQRANVDFFIDYSSRTDILPHVNDQFIEDLNYPFMYVDDLFYLRNNQISIGANIRITYKVKNKYER